MIKQILEKTSKLQTNCFNDEKICLMVSAYDRPEYFKEVAESINKNQEIKDIPIFFFLDGGTHSKTKENIDIIKTIKNDNRIIIARNENYGCERNILFGLKFLFEELNYKYIFVLEDDLVLSEGYFKYLFETYENLKRNDPQIGIFQGWNKCLLSKEEKENQKDLITKNVQAEFWGYIIEQKTWLKIKDIFHPYFELLNSLPYNGGAKLYMETISSKLIREHYLNIIKKYNCDLNSDVVKRFTANHICLGWDGMMELALFAKKLNRYLPIVNRAKTIGKYGIHFYPELWDKSEYEKVTLD